MRLIFRMMSASLVIVALGMAGCSDTPETVTTEQANQADHDHDGEAHVAHDHSGWWCGEHGVPEEECPLCDTSLVADFKANGDWCDEHNRPESQCFQCSPELFGKFAARYEAKFGEQPPTPNEN